MTVNPIQTTCRQRRLASALRSQSGPVMTPVERIRSVGIDAGYDPFPQYTSRRYTGQRPDCPAAPYSSAFHTFPDRQCRHHRRKRYTRPLLPPYRYFALPRRPVALVQQMDVWITIRIGLSKLCRVIRRAIIYDDDLQIFRVCAISESIHAMNGSPVL